MLWTDQQCRGKKKSLRGYNRMDVKSVLRIAYSKIRFQILSHLMRSVFGSAISLVMRWYVH
jgi:hypothetical protein